MAVDQLGPDISLEAAADLSSKQFYGVVVDTNGEAELCNAAGEECDGVLQNDPASGEMATVRTYGVTKAIAGTGGVTRGDKIKVAADGRFVPAVTGKVDTSDAGAAADPLIGSYVVGKALTTAAEGEVFSLLIKQMGAVPTTAA